jgi:TPR repeat protein
MIVTMLIAMMAACAAVAGVQSEIDPFESSRVKLDALIAEMSEGDPRPVAVQRIIDEAETGDAKRQFMLAIMHDRGQFVAKSQEKAALWVKRSAMRLSMTIQQRPGVQ